MPEPRLLQRERLVVENLGLEKLLDLVDLVSCVYGGHGVLVEVDWLLVKGRLRDVPRRVRSVLAVNICYLWRITVALH